MRKSALKVRVLAGVLAVVYVAVVLIVWTVQTRAAADRLDSLMEPSVACAIDTVDWAIEPEVLHVARVLADRWKSADVAALADLRSVQAALDCDQINVVGTNNVVVASTDPASVGFDMTSAPEADEFTALNRGEIAFKTQRFRQSRGCRPSGDGGMWFKYAGLPFPGGGYVVAGNTYRDFRKRYFGVFELLVEGMNVGADGYYLLVDRADGTIVSGFKAEWAGCPFADSGIDPQAFGEDESVRTARVFGVRSYVRRARLAFVEMDIYVVVPVDEILSARNFAVTMAALVVGLIFLLGGLLFCKVIRQHERIEDLFAREALRVEEDLAMARAIQANALPSVFPPYPNLRDVIDIRARMRPAREVGGDFYDFFFTGPGKLALVIADVSGKGIPAALFMMRAKATLQGLLRSGLGLAEAVGRANRRLAEQNDANMFVTAWIGVVDLASGALEFVSAGHEPPLLKRADGSVGFLEEVAGPALGMMAGAAYRTRARTLAAGDGLVLYTDGVTEARNAAREFYGAERFAATLKGLIGAKDAGAVIDGIVKDVDAFAGGAEQADDITLLAFRLVGSYCGIIAESGVQQEGFRRAETL